MNNSCHHVDHTRTLHIDFDLYAKGEPDIKLGLVPSIIDTLEDLSQALQKTVQRKEAQPFLSACSKAAPIIRMLKDRGLMCAAAKLRAHFQNEITLDDLSLRKNVVRLMAISIMLIEALKGRGMVA